MARLIVIAAVIASLVVVAACGAARATQAPPLAATLDAAFALAKADGKPVVLVLRDEADVASIDAGRWLDDADLARELSAVHACRLWSWDEAARPREARVGVNAFAADGRPIAAVDVPQDRAGFRALLADIADDQQIAQPAEPSMSPDEDAIAERLRWTTLLDRVGDEARRVAGAEPFAEAAARAVIANVADAATPLIAELPDLRAARDAAAQAPDKATLEALGKACVAARRALRDQVRERVRALATAQPGSARARGWALWVEGEAAQRDPAAEASLIAHASALAELEWPADIAPDIAAGLVHVVVEFDQAPLRPRVAAAIRARLPRGRGAADAFMDLADDAFNAGARDEAIAYWQDAEAAAVGSSPTFAYLAKAAWHVAEGAPDDDRDAFERRTALDAVVLVRDLPSFARAIQRWTPTSFFPVLFDDGFYAPRFVAAYKPARVLRMAADAGDDAVSFTAAKAITVESLRTQPAPTRPETWMPVSYAEGSNVVFTDGGDCMAAAVALACGRFQALVELPLATFDDNGPRPVRPTDHIPRRMADEMAVAVRDGLRVNGAWHNDSWSYATLAGGYPFRLTGATYERWGNTYALDDYLGRDEHGVRRAVVGRIQGPRERALYQAMCSLFLQPDSALLFNTYGSGRGIFGRYHMGFAEQAWSPLMPITHLKDEHADVRSFRRATHPWNAHPLIVINSSGGGWEWSVAGGGGASDDFPIGVPSVIHTTHSGSAADPYDADTLAGRALWGGTYAYFGSCAEPFLTAFQPSRHFAPRIAAGAPYAASFRKRHGQQFAQPWRLLYVGDPLAALRRTPQTRKPAAGMVVEPGEEEIDVAVASRIAPGAAGSRAALIATREAASAELDAALDAKDVATACTALGNVLRTDPPGNYLGRRIDEVVTLAPGNDGTAVLAAWLAAALDDPALANARGPLAQRLSAVRLEAALAAPTWDEGMRVAALDGVAEAVRARTEVTLLAERLAEVEAAYVARIGGASAALFAGELETRVAGDDAAHLKAAFAVLVGRRSLFKDWLLIGPFPGAPTPSIDAAVLADTARTGVDASGTPLTWTRPFVAGAIGAVDLVPLFTPHDNVHAYATAMIEVEREQDVWLLIGSDDGVAAWLDGSQVWDNPVMRGMKQDEDQVRVHLAPGTHRLVLRVSQGGGGWGFCVRLAADGLGAPVEGVRWRNPAD